MPEASSSKSRYGHLDRMAAGFVRAVLRAPLLVVLLSLALAAAGGWLSATRLGINTDTTDMLSKELQFRKDFARFRAAFPQFANELVVVVDAATADQAADAASRLAAALRQKTDRFSSVFFPAGSDFFQTNGLLFQSPAELDRLAGRLARAQPLLAELARDTSIRGLAKLLSEALGALGTKNAPSADQLGPVLDAVNRSLAARLTGKSAPVSWMSLIGAAGPAGPTKRQIIVVQARQDFGSLSPAKAAMRALRDEAEKLGLTAANGISVRLTGSAAIGSEELDSVAAGAGQAGLLSLVLVAILLVWGLGSLRAVFSVLATLIVGLILTAAFATLAIGTLNLISVAFAVLFIGLGVDFGIHFALRYREEINPEEPRARALERAAGGVGRALILSAVAAAAAFLSFLPTDYRGISELGLIAGAGMAIALLLSLSLLPALLAVLPGRRVRAASGPGSLSLLGEQAVTQFWRPILIVGFLAGVAGLALAPGIRFDRNTLNLKDPTTESVRTAVALIRDGGGRIGAISVLLPDGKSADALSARLKKLPSVASVRYVRDFIPTGQAEKLEVIEDLSLQMLPVLNPASRSGPPDAKQRRAALNDLLAATRAVVRSGRAGAMRDKVGRLERNLSAYLAATPSDAALAALDRDLTGSLPARLDSLRKALSARTVTLASLPADLKARYLTGSGVWRLEVLPKQDLRAPDALRTFVSEVTGVAPGATGSPVVELNAGDAVVASFVTATLIAAGVILLLLFALLRRLGDVVLVLAPLVLAAALTLGTAVLFGAPINFANIIVLPLLIGLGVASAIHIVMRARAERQAGDDPDEAEAAVLETSTPRAVLFSALTTIASFGSLAISSHRGTASMGELLMVAIVYTLVSSLLFLPSLMRWLDLRRAAMRKR